MGIKRLMIGYVTSGPLLVSETTWGLNSLLSRSCCPGGRGGDDGSIFKRYLPTVFEEEGERERKREMMMLHSINSLATGSRVSLLLPILSNTT